MPTVLHYEIPNIFTKCRSSAISVLAYHVSKVYIPSADPVRRYVKRVSGRGCIFFVCFLSGAVSGIVRRFSLWQCLCNIVNIFVTFVALLGRLIKMKSPTTAVGSPPASVLALFTIFTIPACAHPQIRFFLVGRQKKILLIAKVVRDHFAVSFRKQIAVRFWHSYTRISQSPRKLSMEHIAL